MRLASAADAAEIARIYNQGIEDRLATFETEPRTVAEVKVLLAERLPGHSAVVLEARPGLAGFAWTSPYSSRPFYAGIVEFSVYVAREARGRGAGKRLLSHLVATCEARGLWKLTTRVLPENRASLAVCASAGFREVGIHRRHAQLDGEWRDCVVVERLLGEAL